MAAVASVETMGMVLEGVWEMRAVCYVEDKFEYLSGLPGPPNWPVVDSAAAVA